MRREVRQLTAQRRDDYVDSFLFPLPRITGLVRTPMKPAHGSPVRAESPVGEPAGTLRKLPGIHSGTGAKTDVRVGSSHRRGPSRVRDCGPPARARHRLARRRRRAGADLRTRCVHRGRGGYPRLGPVGCPRERSDTAERARAARAALRRSSVADAHALPRARAARRSLGRRHGRDRGGARARPLARADARAPAVRPRRRRARALPRRGRIRLGLPRHPPPRRLRARGDGRRAGGGPAPADSADDRERLRADGPDRARRLGDRRAASGGDPRVAARVRAALRRAGGGDGALRVVRTVTELRETLEPLRAGELGLVPTMGAYHAGHVALFEAARAENDAVAASLFVNRAQFTEEADFERYPRDEQADLRA